MISVRFSLKDKLTKSKTTIRTSVSFNGQRFVFCPGVSLSPHQWDFKRGQPKQVKDNLDTKKVTDTLKELELTIRKLYDELQVPFQKVEPEIFKRRIIQQIKGKKPVKEDNFRLDDFFREFISDCEKGKRLTINGTRFEDDSIKPYRTTLIHFIDFQKENDLVVMIDDFNQDIQDEFLEYLEITLEKSRNTSSKYIMCLIQVLKMAVSKKLMSPVDFSQIHFNTRREESDNIYLTEPEISSLMELNEFKCEQDEIVRDLFIVGCYTGLRFGNYSNISFDNIRNGTIDVIQVKTKTKISIPIHPSVENILKKYDYKLPSSPTNQEFNRTLKEICCRIPELNITFSKMITKGRRKTTIDKKKWEMVMTHTARRSFCTNMYNKGVPILTIMAFSGHKSEKNLKKYIKSSIEDHTKIIKGFWNYNNSD